VNAIESSKLDEMMAEAPAAINFTVFLNMSADKLHRTDSEEVIRGDFKVFDPEAKGTIS
jgi:Ca2+-binding EF-hand superfamily protein